MSQIQEMIKPAAAMLDTYPVVTTKQKIKQWIKTCVPGMTPEKALDWVESDMIPFYPLGVYKDTDVKKLNPTSTKEEN